MKISEAYVRLPNRHHNVTTSGGWKPNAPAESRYGNVHSMRHSLSNQARVSARIAITDQIGANRFGYSLRMISIWEGVQRSCMSNRTVLPWDYRLDLEPRLCLRKPRTLQTPTTLRLATMAPVAVESAPVVPANPPQIKQAPSAHPLDPLSADEITGLSAAVRQYVATQTPIKAFKYIGAETVLPPKRDVLAYLGIRTSPGSEPDPYVEVSRKADVDIIDVITGFKESEWVVDGTEQLPEGQMPQLSVNELIEAEQIVRNDERVKKLCADVGPDQIYADGWSLGYDERFSKKLRLQQCLLYARFGEDENIYAHPLDFIPVIDSNAKKVIHIDFPSHPKSGLHTASADYSTQPPNLEVTCDRGRIPPPKMKHEYLADHLDTANAPREPLKPLHVIQPEGVSFKMSGNILEWQQWKMHIVKTGFTAREGVVLGTVTYNDAGEVRPVFYRMSCAEMVVPYGSPDHPHPRKFAFDVGEYGMGVQANELSLGCDCLEDAAFYWNFYLDGTVELETRLTGILNVYTLAEGEQATFGTQVAPRINAQYHQHLFSIRVDPMVDGINNTVIESDIKPYPYATGSAENYAGNGFISVDTPVTEASGREYSHETDRRWRIVNRSRTHYSSGLPVAYSVGIGGATRGLLAQPESWVRERAGFATKSLWVVPSDEATSGGRRWPAGRHVPQTRTQPKDSVVEWTKNGESVDDKDILLFLTVGVSVHWDNSTNQCLSMPTEHLRIVFKPIGFFKANPALDVKAPVDERSRNAFPAGDIGTGAVVEHTNGNGSTQASTSCDRRLSMIVQGLGIPQGIHPA
ncbi:peroxisomal copper amine oxidase [Rhizoctonia solani AG-1 IA]|uniref:Amine oxidase n=1 Tax=Thanatephorus cucumeris (strain AG1-IA) TaxID=983506 RepID=L8WPZ9_THACA|nr:peroxisomal copper amine oxidase [Rhizoctonia solani AG-1 IA]